MVGVRLFVAGILLVGTVMACATPGAAPAVNTPSVPPASAATATTQPSSPAASPAPSQPRESTMPFTIKSPSFTEGGAIPRNFSCDGANVSPALEWEGVPDGAAALALIVDDPDAPTEEPWVHWVIYNIPPTPDGLAEGVPRDANLPSLGGAVQGVNTWKTTGYRGPA
ncbi:MAG: YbhB/YbcL family Raf kinase inhibitor-like protein, partial [Chloroflexota bacterium]|nr:YbhB/YbcL family Raf kinase inhibitor-like protein [Chloroflexota bacterium]